MQWGVRRYADAPNGSSEKPRVHLVSRIAGQDLVRFYRPGDQSFGVTYGCRPPSRGIRSAWFTSPSTRPRATGCAPCSRGEEAKRRRGDLAWWNRRRSLLVAPVGSGARVGRRRHHSVAMSCLERRRRRFHRRRRPLHFPAPGGRRLCARGPMAIRLARLVRNAAAGIAPGGAQPRRDIAFPLTGRSRQW